VRCFHLGPHGVSISSRLSHRAVGEGLCLPLLHPSGEKRSAPTRLCELISIFPAEGKGKLSVWRKSYQKQMEFLFPSGRRNYDRLPHFVYNGKHPGGKGIPKWAGGSDGFPHRSRSPKCRFIRGWGGLGRRLFVHLANLSVSIERNYHHLWGSSQFYPLPVVGTWPVDTVTLKKGFQDSLGKQVKSLSQVTVLERPFSPGCTGIRQADSGEPFAHRRGCLCGKECWP